MEETEQLIRNGWILSSLYLARVPKKPPSGRNWETFALATLARAHHTLQTILGLERNREPDCAVLARVMFEHVATFAWLMVDPEERYPRLLRSEYNERVKLMADLKPFGVNGPDENEIKRSLAEMGNTAAPPLSTRTLEADSYWTRCGADWNWKLRRIYADLYRPYSSYVHPTVSGLDCFITPGNGGGTIGYPRSVEGGCIPAEAASCFADALAIASQHWGAPTIRELVYAFTDGIPIPESLLNAQA